MHLFAQYEIQILRIHSATHPLCHQTIPAQFHRRVPVRTTQGENPLPPTHYIKPALPTLPPTLTYPLPPPRRHPPAPAPQAAAGAAACAYGRRVRTEEVRQEGTGCHSCTEGGYSLLILKTRRELTTDVSICNLRHSPRTVSRAPCSYAPLNPYRRVHLSASQAAAHQGGNRLHHCPVSLKFLAPFT